MKDLDLIGKEFGRLKVIERSPSKNGRSQWLCQCSCGNVIVVPASYLTTDDTQSCGCLKKEQEKINLREKYDSKRVDDVAVQLFKGQEPRSDSTTGYRGVLRYYTRVSKEERFKAWITVAGKKYYKAGFLTAEDAYMIGRKELEEKYIPKKPSLD